MVERPITEFSRADWRHTSNLESESWRCGFCGSYVSVNTGYMTEDGTTARPCPRCRGLSMFVDGVVIPKPLPGNDVQSVEPSVGHLYLEARLAARVGAHTAAVMACRKILMNIAVSEGAPENTSFKHYVDYLEQFGMFSPRAKPFVDYIRTLGNEATHEIKAMNEEDALAVIGFVESLLHHNYETPAKVPVRNPQP